MQLGGDSRVLASACNRLDQRPQHSGNGILGTGELFPSTSSLAKPPRTQRGCSKPLTLRQIPPSRLGIAGSPLFVSSLSVLCAFAREVRELPCPQPDQLPYSRLFSVSSVSPWWAQMLRASGHGVWVLGEWEVSTFRGNSPVPPKPEASHRRATVSPEPYALLPTPFGSTLLNPDSFLAG